MRAVVLAITMAALILVGPTVSAAPANIVADYACAYGLKRKGCESDYARAVTSVRVDETTFRLTAHGNGYTSAETIYRFVMRRAAEETVAAGYDVFSVFDQQDLTQAYSTRVGGQVYGPNGETTPVVTNHVVKPGEAVTVRMAHGPKPQDAPPNMYDAHEVLRFIGSP